MWLLADTSPGYSVERDHLRPNSERLVERVPNCQVAAAVQVALANQSDGWPTHVILEALR
jgi:hypothetical protein